ncbi:MAG: V-type ATP synthase subunit I [Candidatus Eisenbacteria bacterium]|jgi:V/A-type H+-transporting ATPase subunit I|nr:V-type ATP synthase subunit I [Candidatus Eisenbacteria bacterium]
MAVQPLQRAYIVAHASASDRVVAALHGASIVHLEGIGESERAQLAAPIDVDTRELDRRLGDLETAIDYLGRFSPSGGTPSPPGAGDLATGRDMTDRILSETRRIQGELAEIEVSRTRLGSAIHHVMPWRDLSVPVEWLASTPTTTVLCGTLPLRSVALVRAALAEQGPAWILEEVGTAGGKAHVVLADLANEPPDAERLLREAGFQPMLFPTGSGTVPEILQRLEAQIESLERSRLDLQVQIAALAAQRPMLMTAYDATAVKRQRLEGLRAAVATDESVIVGGWVKTIDVPRLTSLVEKSGTATVIVRDPLPGEEPPVVLHNGSLVAPCQAVTGLYGMPKYREIDPTPLLAPFFVVSFGIAVGEGGYGIVLAIFAKLARRFMKLSEGGKQLMNLLFYCGISTFVAGVLMGSFFAIDFSKTPSSLRFLTGVHDTLMQMDPLKQPLTFLALVLGLGFLQVWGGVLVGAVVAWRAGDRRRALFHNGGWLVLLPLTGLLFARPVVAGIPLLYPWLAAALSIFVSAGFGATNLAARLGSGFFALYGITGFFGDVLSYSRLFALGLATGVMATVINILAGVAAGIPVIGWFAMALILLIGHPVNIAINALGAFVHSARLQFVEFFTKFFEGGGRRFEPFERRLKYVTAVEPKEGNTTAGA